MQWPELWHSADELRTIALNRGLSEQDMAQLEGVQCSGCGISADAPHAFSEICGGFVHWPDCPATDKHIRFVRRRT